MGLRYLLLFLFICTPLFSQEASEIIQLSIESEVVAADQQIWAHSLNYELINGEPANFRFTGDNFQMVIRVTIVKINEDLFLLVVQSETLLQDRNGQMSFHSNMQSTRLPSNYPVIYYPLGGSAQDTPEDVSQDSSPPQETMQDGMMRFTFVLNPQEVDPQGDQL